MRLQGYHISIISAQAIKLWTGYQIMPRGTSAVLTATVNISTSFYHSTCKISSWQYSLPLSDYLGASRLSAGFTDAISNLGSLVSWTVRCILAKLAVIVQLGIYYDQWRSPVWQVVKVLKHVGSTVSPHAFRCLPFPAVSRYQQGT